MNIVRDPDRREVLAASAAVAASSLIAMQARAATASDALRQFNIDVPQAELDELRRRISATRWPEKETVTDESQGVPLAMIQELTRYWATDYDWRKCEAKLNALPQFMTEIDGLDIHFIHVRKIMKRRGLGLSGPTTNSFITTRSIKAGTMQPGSSRNSL
jgi:Epoxide hydrolase N terminus